MILTKLLILTIKINEEYFYIKDIYNKKQVDEAKKALEEKKSIFGNFLNDNNNWNSYCLIPRRSPYTFLYKSFNGEEPSNELINFVKDTTGDYYIQKVNKFSKNNKKEYSDIDAIENTKIMMQQIVENKEEFIQKFEQFDKFCDKNIIEKEKLKKNIFPIIYIKSIYNQIKKKLRIKEFLMVCLNIMLYQKIII